MLNTSNANDTNSNNLVSLASLLDTSATQDHEKYGRRRTLRTGSVGKIKSSQKELFKGGAGGGGSLLVYC